MFITTIRPPQQGFEPSYSRLQVERTTHCAFPTMISLSVLLPLALLVEIAPPPWHVASGLKVGYNSESTNQGAISLALEQAQRDGLLAGENTT